MYLNCKTYNSFGHGSFAIPELVNSAAGMGINAIALTDINSISCAWEFTRACNEKNIQPIIGTEIRNGDELLYILLAANNRGVQWINHFLSVYLIAGKDFPQATDDKHFFDDPDDGFVIYPLGKKKLQDLLFNEYAGIGPSQINRLSGADLTGVASKLVILYPVTLRDKADKDFFLPEMTLLQKFGQYPFIVMNTYKLMDACNTCFEYDKDKKHYPVTPLYN